MAKNNRVCKVCGKSYSYCPNCYNDSLKPSWLSMFDSKNCYDIFLLLSNLTNENLSKEEAKEKLLKLDTINVINETIRKRINSIISPENKTEDVIEKNDNLISQVELVENYSDTEKELSADDLESKNDESIKEKVTVKRVYKNRKKN